MIASFPELQLRNSIPWVACPEISLIFLTAHLSDSHKKVSPGTANYPGRHLLFLSRRKQFRLIFKRLQPFLGMSLCSALTRYPAFFSRLAISSAIITLRCWPPVQPKATVR